MQRLFGFEILCFRELLGVLAGFLGGHDFLLLKYSATDSESRADFGEGSGAKQRGQSTGSAR
jgi:hypothetical protein